MQIDTVRPRIEPRRPHFDFAAVPRHWWADSAIVTHIANGANLVFPAGERFFVRSVRHFADVLRDDPKLAEEVRGFYVQESRHSQAHEVQFEALEAQGYRIRRFLSIYEKVAYDWLESRMTPELRLSITAALEHFTAIMARNAFEERLLDFAHPVMSELLYWHAAEEIEHKAVAFDVLRKVNPSYALRMQGLAIAAVGLAAFWLAATTTLLVQDVSLTRKVPRWPAVRRKDRSIGKDVFAKGIRAYLRRDFHPLDDDHDLAVAHAWLESVGMLRGSGARAAA